VIGSPLSDSYAKMVCITDIPYKDVMYNLNIASD